MEDDSGSVVNQGNPHEPVRDGTGTSNATFCSTLLYEAQTTAQLKGLVSEPTRLELLSFVDDVDYEQEMMER